MLTDVKGKQHAPFKSEKTKAVVFVFMLRDCPVSNVYAPELTRIHKEYSAKGVALYLVHPDRDTNAKSAIAHAKEYKLIAPVVLCLLYTSPSPRDQRGSRMPSSA